MTVIRIYAGEIWHTPSAPAPGFGAGSSGQSGLVVLEDGGLAVLPDGTITATGPLSKLRTKYPQAEVTDYRPCIIVPGLIDSHLHFPQIDMIGAMGAHLLDWLKTHTFPAELAYADDDFARGAAERFCTELIANGTTTAAVYAASYKSSADLLFAAAARRGLRLIAGKVSMDTGAPEGLLANPVRDRDDQEELIARWHGHQDRLFVALTPRFALSCTKQLLKSLGSLRQTRPDLYVQTHHAENPDEIRAVRTMFPECRDYLSVYHDHGLLGPRTILGHSIHVTDDELDLIAKTGTVISHCPTSNLFLGSGLFPWDRFRARNIPVTLGSDIGAGTSFSMLRTMSAAYNVQKLRHQPVSPVWLLYSATQGAAEALGLGRVTGSFEPGKDADFQVIRWDRSRLLRQRFEASQSPADRLAAWMTLGDDRLVADVFVRGRSLVTF